MFGAIRNLFGGASKVAGKASGGAANAAKAASKGGLWNTTKKFMGSSFGQGVLWSVAPAAVMSIIGSFTADA